MRKIISALLVLVLAFSLAACSGGGSSGGSASGGEKQLVIGFAQIGAESDWRVGCTNSVKSAVADAGWELKFVDAQGKQENQIKALKDFITQGVDYIGFSPVVE